MHVDPHEGSAITLKEVFDFLTVGVLIKPIEDGDGSQGCPGSQGIDNSLVKLGRCSRVLHRKFDHAQQAAALG